MIVEEGSSKCRMESFRVTKPVELLEIHVFVDKQNATRLYAVFQGLIGNLHSIVMSYL